uniref:POTRA domain-containing protein n=1 Tax=Corynoplastis japonica TaxID=700918 RepID=A0A1X9PU26_9RHOD|nr:hypothetical protein [Corynoplastis japonica]
MFNQILHKKNLYSSIIISLQNTNKTTHGNLKHTSNTNKIFINQNVKTYIYLHGIENEYQKQLISKLFNIKTTTNLEDNKLFNIIRAMKISGFFNQIKVTYIIDPKYQKVNIYVKLNPIIKQISFFYDSSLLIPSYLIRKFFDYQIGFPKSFKEINIALDKIIKWYRDKGYCWATIQIIDHQLNANHLKCKINEGVLDNIVIKYYPHINRSSNTVITSFTDKLIREYLNIYKGKSLNKNLLESSINQLQNYKIIDKGYYEVIRSSKNHSQIHLILDIYLFPQDSTSVLMHNFFRFSSNTLLNKIYNHKIFRTPNLKTILYQINNSQDWKKKWSVLNWKHINFYPQRFYKFNSCYRNKLNDTMILLKIDYYTYPNNIKITYSCPFNTLKQTINNFTIQLFHERINIKHQDKKKYDPYYNNYTYNPSIILSTLRSELKYFLQPNIQFIQQVLIKNYKLCGSKITYNPITQYLLNSYVNIDKKNKHICTKNQEWKTISQKDSSLLVELKHDTINQITWPVSGSAHSVKLEYKLPVTRYNNLFFYINQNVAYNIKLYNEIYIPLLNIYYSQYAPFIICNTSFTFSFNDYKCIELSQILFDIGYSVSNKSIKNNSHTQSLNNLNVEYHFYVQKYYSLFLILSYKQQLTNYLQLMKTSIGNYNHHTTINIYNQIIIGIGKQIRVPIRQIPIIRLQYMMTHQGYPRFLFTITTDKQ